MKKIGLIFREESEKRIKNGLKESNSAFIVNYLGLSSPDLTALRQSLNGINGRFLVVKNSVARRALKDSGLELLIEKVEGPCALIFVKDEAVDVSRLLYNFSKEHQQLRLEGGFLNEKIIDKKDIEVLAVLPSKEILRTKAVIALKAPITGMVLTFIRTLKKFVVSLNRIKDEKVR